MKSIHIRRRISRRVYRKATSVCLRQTKLAFCKIDRQSAAPEGDVVHQDF